MKRTKRIGVGKVVELVIGGEPMAVLEVDSATGIVTCAWWHGTRLMKEALPRAALRLVDFEAPRSLQDLAPEDPDAPFTRVIPPEALRVEPWTPAPEPAPAEHAGEESPELQ